MSRLRVLIIALWKVITTQKMLILIHHINFHKMACSNKLEVNIDNDINTIALEVHPDDQCILQRVTLIVPLKQNRMVVPPCIYVYQIIHYTNCL